MERASLSKISKTPSVTGLNLYAYIRLGPRGRPSYGSCSFQNGTKQIPNCLRGEIQNNAKGERSHKNVKFRHHNPDSVGFQIQTDTTIELMLEIDRMFRRKEQLSHCGIRTFASRFLLGNNNGITDHFWYRGCFEPSQLHIRIYKKPLGNACSTN